MPMLKGRPVGITGLGIHLPERVLTNAELEKMVDTSDEWIKSRSGIQERRITDPGLSTSDLAVAAGTQALLDAGVRPEDVDLIIVATISPDMYFPATACIVQDKIGAVRAAAFDLEAGCSGFVYALAVGSQFIKSGLYNTVLVIGAEALSKIIDWEDRNTCVLFGDGAGAAVLQEVAAGYGILSIELGSDGAGAELLKMPARGSGCDGEAAAFNVKVIPEKLDYLEMVGREVYKFAVKIIGTSAIQAVVGAGLKAEDIDCFIPHQANIRIIEAAAKRLGVSMDRVYVNVQKYGNTSAASIPVALFEAVHQGRIKKGDNIVIVGFGAGLTWGSSVIRWSR